MSREFENEPEENSPLSRRTIDQGNHRAAVTLRAIALTALTARSTHPCVQTKTSKGCAGACGACPACADARASSARGDAHGCAAPPAGRPPNARGGGGCHARADARAAWPRGG